MPVRAARADQSGVSSRVRSSTWATVSLHADTAAAISSLMAVSPVSSPPAAPMSLCRRPACSDWREREIPCLPGGGLWPRSGPDPCVSALGHDELWIPVGMEDRRPHLRLPVNVPLSGRDCVNHRAAPVARPDARTLWDSLENVLMCVSVCLPADQAFAVWESALSRGLVTAAQPRRIAWPSARARRLAAEASHLSDSGMESTFVWRCRRAGIRVVQQVMIAGQPVDGLIGKRLVVQLDGFAFHKDAAQRRRDIRHDRELVAHGYTVLRFDYVDVMHNWPRVEREIRRAISLGLAD